MTADPSHVDHGGFQDLRQLKAVAHGDDHILGFHHDGVTERIFLVQQFQHGGLQGVNGRRGAAGNQVVVGVVEQGNAVENGGVVDQDLVNLLVDRALCACSVQAGNLGNETHVVVDKRLAGHAELAAKGVDLALGKQF